MVQPVENVTLELGVMSSSPTLAVELILKKKRKGKSGDTAFFKADIWFEY